MNTLVWLSALRQVLYGVAHVLNSKIYVVLLGFGRAQLTQDVHFVTMRDMKQMGDANALNATGKEDKVRKQT